MKKMLNTLFVTTQGAWLNKEGETVVVNVDGEKRLQLPVLTLDGIVCFGQVGMSSYLMGFCAERDITVSYHTEYGRFLARVQGPVAGNVLLRREQYRWADDDEKSADMARAMVTGKIANSRFCIERTLRDHPEKIDKALMRNASSRLRQAMNRARRTYDLDVIRGAEGEASNVYFGVFNQFITGDGGFFFKGRSRRPPLDEVNCMLSFVYTLLMHDVRSALESVGLDPCVGFLHRDRPGRPSLALDMMEEFRACIADRLVLRMINRGQVDMKDFEIKETGGVLMTDKARKAVLQEYQKRKQEEITHPYLKDKMKTGLLFYTQALLLARFIRGDIDGYPVFLWR